MCDEAPLLPYQLSLKPINTSHMALRLAYVTHLTSGSNHSRVAVLVFDEVPILFRVIRLDGA
jgi:hypothetical protein